MMIPNRWTKADASQLTNCVEAQWKTATASGPYNDACAEVRQAVPGGEIEVRDTKDRDGGTLSFTPAEWAAFLDGVKRGEFDLPA